MNPPKTTPYLVSDRAFRIIMTEVQDGTPSEVFIATSPQSLRIAGMNGRWFHGTTQSLQIAPDSATPVGHKNTNDRTERLFSMRSLVLYIVGNYYLTAILNVLPRSLTIYIPPVRSLMAVS